MNTKVTVKAKPDGLWTLVELPRWTAPMRLCFTAEDQEWKYAKTNACKADGDLLSMIDGARTLLGTGPVGALIGKIGGSSAGAKDGAALFLVGRYLCIETKPEWKGSLYLTINDEITGFANNDGSIDVNVTAEPV